LARGQAGSGSATTTVVVAVTAIGSHKRRVSFEPCGEWHAVKVNELVLGKSACRTHNQGPFCRCRAPLVECRY